MAKIQEVLPAESSFTDTLLEQVENNDEKNVFSNERQHSEKHAADCADERSIQSNYYVKQLNCSTYNGRPTFAIMVTSRKLKSVKPCLYDDPNDTSDLQNRFAPDREETMTLDNESRSKLNKDYVKPYDYTRQNSLYEIFKAPSRSIFISWNATKNVRLNPRASAQNKDAKSHKTTKRYMPVEKSSASKKPERQILTGHRFSNKKTTTVPEKKMNPRSCLRWKPTGRIFSNVRLRYIVQSYKGRTQSLVAEKTDISENRASRNFDLMINILTFEQRSSSLVLH
ncbi:hypothetical protein Tco_1499461 [Tanacetum coccineum]